MNNIKIIGILLFNLSTIIFLYHSWKFKLRKKNNDIDINTIYITIFFAIFIIKENLLFLGLQSLDPILNLMLGISSLACIYRFYTKYKLQIKLTSASEIQDAYELLRVHQEIAFDMLVISNDGFIVEVNDTFCEISGYSKEEIVGKNIIEFIYKDDIITMLRNTKDNNRVNYQLRGYNKNGDLIYMKVRGKTMMYKNQTVRVAALQDITNEVKQVKQLQEAIEVLELSERNNSLRTTIQQTITNFYK